MTHFTKPALGFLSLTLLMGGTTAAYSQDYASGVVGSTLTSNAPYNDPNAALGQPTTLINDGGGNGEVAGVYHGSLVFPAFNTDSTGLDSSKKLIVSLGNSATGPGTLTLKMAAPITHSDSHWYGDDFIVYGNATFTGANAAGDFAITPTTDMSQYFIDQYGIFQSAVPTVSVSADGIHFTQLTTDQTFFPENPYSWAGISDSNPSGFGALNDFTKPVDRSITPSEFMGKSVAYADNTLYGGSAGGQAFSLVGSGLSSIQYIEFTGFGNVDAVAGVSDNPAAVPETSTLVSLGLLLGLGIFAVRRKKTA